MKTHVKNVAVFSALLGFAVAFAAPSVQAAPTSQAHAETPIYNYVYSPKRAVGSLYHSTDLASAEIRQQAGIAAKSSAVEEIAKGRSHLQQQFAYALYVPKYRKPRTTIDWRVLA